MILKKSLKFTLPALMLAASTSAFAAEEVTLNDPQKTKISWSEFVKSVNNPNEAVVKVTGKDISKDENLDVVRDYLAAQKTTAEKLDSLNARKKDKVDADTALAKAQRIVAGYEAEKAKQDKIVTDKTNELPQAVADTVTARTNVTNYVQNVVYGKKGVNGCTEDGAGTIYDAAEADLAAWNKQVSNLNTSITSLTGQSQVLSGKLDDARDELTALQKQYDALDKEITQETKTEIVPWLNDIYTAAKKLKTEFKTGVASTIMNPKCKVYYTYQDKTVDPELEGAEMLYLAFAPVEDYKEMDTKSLATFLTNNHVALTCVYMGDDYVDDDEGLDGFLYIEYTSKSAFVNNIINAIEELLKNPAYAKTTVTNKVEYKDPAAEKELSDKIDEKNKEITSYRTQRSEVNTQLDQAKDDLKDVTDKINNYTEVVDKTTGLTQQQQLKANLDYALKEGKAEVDAKLKAAKDKVEEIKQEIADAEKAATAAQNNATAAKADVTDARAVQSAAQTAVTEADNAYQNAVKEEAAAKKAVDDAQAVENQKAFDVVYGNVTLTADVTADVKINSYSGHIDGDNHGITITGDYLIDDFTGVIVDAAITGSGTTNTVVTRNNGHLYNVPVWYGTSGRYYDNTGANEVFTDMGKYIYDSLRDGFGADLANKKIVKLTPESRVYKITIDTPDDKGSVTSKTSYVNAINGTFYSYNNKEGFAVPVNQFAISGSDDLLDVDGFVNIVYDGYCKKVVIEDRKAFYCPVNLTAETLEYDRKFVVGQNAVCLPFALKHELHKKILFLSTYSSEDEDRFWFNKIEEGVTIAANTPALLVAQNSFSFTKDNALHNVSLLATPMKQILSVDSDDSKDESQSWGTFKNAGRDNFLGAAQSEYIYGLAKDGKFQQAGDGAVFPALRMVLSSRIKPKNAQGAPARRIGLRNAFGEDISEELDVTAIDGVKAQATGVSVAGGKGEIVITAEAAQGDVAIYTVDGKLIKVADVAEGTTTVKVQTGVYVVMGKKVMVK